MTETKMQKNYTTTNLNEDRAASLANVKYLEFTRTLEFTLLMKK